MSKSLGNGIDPMDVIEEYGVDALRYFLISNSAPGMDLRYDTDKVKSSWNFINKLWNASRYVLMNIEDLNDANIDLEKLTIADKWILTKKNLIIRNVTKQIDKYNFHNASNELYNFIWNDFCDNYIELTKGETSKTTKSVLLNVLTDILKMLHPFIPFVTEEIYQMLPIKDAESIMISKYPTYNKEYVFKDDTEKLTKVLEDIVAIRNLKASNKITKDAFVKINCKKEVENIYKTSLKIKDSNLINNILDKTSINYKSKYIEIVYFFDKEEADLEKINEEIKKLSDSIKRRKTLLANENYVNKAPIDIVEKDRKQLALEEEKLELLRK